LESKERFELDFYLSSDDWIEALKEAFPHSFPYPRAYLEIEELKYENWRDMIPEGFTIYPIDLSLLQKSHLRNYAWIVEEIEENWLPFEDNLKEIRGFYIEKNNKEIVSWCAIEYLTEDNEVEVGIATRQEYRKLGLALGVGSATAEYCLSKYKSIGWHCSVNNIASIKLAEKIGFKAAKNYMKVACFFNKYDNLIVHGYYKFLNKKYKEAIKCYTQVIDAHTQDVEDIRSSVYLTKWGFTIDKLLLEVAIIYAAQGRVDEALVRIRLSIEQGYEDIEAFDKEENFKNLHNQKEWEELRKAILKNKRE